MYQLGYLLKDSMRQVPWESWQQWHYVRCCFLSTSPTRITEALSRVSAWKSRGGLPVAVEITAGLIRIHLQDPSITAGISQDAALSNELLQMLYATAIMRLVNGVVDQAVKRNTSSVANRAEAASLPRSFVDIRHETSHNELPSLPLLRHASKQALEWLQANYWDEQEQVLLETQTILKSKLVEHAGVVLNIFSTQQLLASEEGKGTSILPTTRSKGQDRKQKILALKRSRKVLNRQQQALLREVLELAQFGTSDVARLLLKHICSAEDLSQNVPKGASKISELSFGYEVSNSESEEDDVSEMIVELEKNCELAWKYTIGQLSEHMPYLPATLLSNLVNILVDCKSSHEPSSSDTLGGKSIFDFGEVLPEKLTCKKQVVRWVFWILDHSSAVFKEQKVPHASQLRLTSQMMQAVLPQDTLRELTQKCLNGNMDKDTLVRLVSRISQLVNDISFGKRANLLAQCKKTEVEEIGGDFRVQYRTQESAGSERTNEEFNSDTAVANSRKLQEESIKEWFAHVRDTKRVDASEAPPTPGPWSKVKNWKPCAIGLLPSEFSSEGITPQFDTKRNTGSQRVVEIATVDDTPVETAMGEVECTDTVVSSETVNGVGTIHNLKRKDTEGPAGTELEQDAKKQRGGGSAHDNNLSTHQSMYTADDLLSPKFVMYNDAELMEIDPDKEHGEKVNGNAEEITVETNPVVEAVKWQGYLMQRGVLQLRSVQDLHTLQGAIRVL